MQRFDAGTEHTKKMQWKLALRIATSPSGRWLNKAAEWNPELSSRYGTNRAIGRPRKRWEDDINDFLKQIREEKEKDEPIERKIQNNNGSATAHLKGTPREAQSINTNCFVPVGFHKLHALHQVSTNLSTNGNVLIHSATTGLPSAVSP